MAPKLFFTFLLLTVVCFFIAAIAVHLGVDKYKAIISFYSCCVTAFFFATVASAVLWIWS